MILDTDCDEETSGTDEDDHELPRVARHVVHIGIDGLHPCFVEAGAPNIIDRLGAEGAYTLTMGRTALESVSAPGWSNLITGESA